MSRLRPYFKWIATLTIIVHCSQSGSNELEPPDEIEEAIPEGAIKINYDRYVYIPIFFNDSIKANAMFDIGAPGLPLMDDSLAPMFKFKYEKGHFMTCYLLNGCVFAKLPKSELKTKIGDLEFLQKFAIYDLDKFECDIQIGAEKFREKVIELDLDQEYMLISDSISKIPEYSAEIIGGKHLKVQLTIVTQSGESYSGNYILDTGYPGMIMLFDKTEKNEIFNQIPDSAKIIAKNLDGRTDCLFKPAKIKIGNYELNEPIIKVFNLTKKGVKGLVGNRFFEMFNVKLDLLANKLYLTPKEQKIEQPFNKFHSGVGFQISDKDVDAKYIVSAVVSGRKAEKAGFKLGDMVLEINGVKTKDIELDTLKSLCKMPIGTKHNLLIKRGDSLFEKQLVLEKLY